MQFCLTHKDIKRELENIYLSVETHVMETKNLCDTKINSVVRKMLKLELTIGKLSDLAESAKQSLVDHDDDKDKASAEVEKEWDSIKKAREDLAKEREQLNKDREELNKQREEFNQERELARSEKEKKRERKTRVTVGLPAESDSKAVHIPAEDITVNKEQPSPAEELDISTDDLQSAEEALRRSTEEPESATTATAEPTQESQEPQPPQQEEIPMEDIVDGKKIVLVQSFVRRWIDRRNYRFASM